MRIVIDFRLTGDADKINFSQLLVKAIACRRLISALLIYDFVAFEDRRAMN